MNSSERRMKLILMLQQAKSRITIQDIAEEFNISKRTVYRDFNALSELNVPVTWDKYNGYSMIEGYKIPPLMFTQKELATILVGLNFVKSQVDQTLIEDAKGVELKIKEVVPDELRDFMESLEERTVVDPYLNFGAEKKEGGNWYTLSQAIATNKTIAFNYSPKTGDRLTSRRVDPYLIVFYRDHWNLIGYSHKRKDIRNFLLDRMADIEILEDDFVPYGKIDEKELIYRSNGRSYKIVVDVHTSALDRFKANLPAKIFKEKEINPNLFRIHFKFDNLEFINEWLLQFPKDLEIQNPEKLKDIRSQLLRDMIDQM